MGHFFQRAFFSVDGLEPSSECIYRIRQGRQKMWPHLAILGATGVPKQIGQAASCDCVETRIWRTLLQSMCTSASTV